jgi:hypothetical protein
VQGSGFKGSGYKGSRVQGFRVQGSRVQGFKGAGFRVQGSGFRVQGSGFRVQGFRVEYVSEARERTVGSVGPCPPISMPAPASLRESRNPAVEQPSKKQIIIPVTVCSYRRRCAENISEGGIVFLQLPVGNS